jgi:hypothetical protein
MVCYMCLYIDHREDIAADILIYMVHRNNYNSLCICVHILGFDYTSWYKARVTDLET